jgi:uncharacterized phiE125 gp8 family phage protein
MTLQLITPPAAVSISLHEVRAQCRVEDGSEDALLAGYVRSATDYVEQHSGLRLITQTWNWHIDGFPWAWDGYIRLPLGPIQSITSITYLDTQGVQQTLAPTVYSFRGDRIMLAPNATWPVSYRSLDVITVTFVCGFGGDHNTVPESLRQAISMLAAYWFAQREAAQVDPDARVFDVPFSVREIIEPYRLWAV